MSGRQRRADAALAALQADAQARRAEQDRRDGEPRATVKRLIREVQNAAHNSDDEAQQVAAKVVEQLVALTAPDRTISYVASALGDMRVVAETLGSTESRASGFGLRLREGHPEWSDERAMLAALRALAEEEG